MSQPGSVPGTPGPVPSTQQMGGNMPPFMSQAGETTSMLRQPQPQPAGHSGSGEPHPGLSRQLPGHPQGEDDEIFTGE